MTLEVVQVTTAEEVLSAARGWLNSIGLRHLPHDTVEVLMEVVLGDRHHPSWGARASEHRERAERYYYDWLHCTNHTRRTEG